MLPILNRGNEAVYESETCFCRFKHTDSQTRRQWRLSPKSGVRIGCKSPTFKFKPPFFGLLVKGVDCLVINSGHTRC